MQLKRTFSRLHRVQHTEKSQFGLAMELIQIKWYLHSGRRWSASVILFFLSSFFFFFFFPFWWVWPKCYSFESYSRVSSEQHQLDHPPLPSPHSDFLLSAFSLYPRFASHCEYRIPSQIASLIRIDPLKRRKAFHRIISVVDFQLPDELGWNLLNSICPFFGWTWKMKRKCMSPAFLPSAKLSRAAAFVAGS